MRIPDYSDESIMRVLQRAIDVIEEDRQRAIDLFDIMKEKMMEDDSNMVVLSQMADKYLDQSTKSNEHIIKLAAVMERLKKGKGDKDVDSKFAEYLKELDLEGVTPIKYAKGQAVVPPKKKKPNGEMLKETAKEQKKPDVPEIEFTTEFEVEDETPPEDSDDSGP